MLVGMYMGNRSKTGRTSVDVREIEKVSAAVPPQVGEAVVIRHL